MSSGTVSVRGTALVGAQPDEVRLALEVSALEPTAESALSVVAERSAELETILDELGISEERRSTSGLSVREEREYENRRYVHRGYAASNRVVVRLADPAPLGGLMSEATRRAKARIDGPWWWVALDNPARARACREAAEEARRKAEAYASALGARLGAVDEVIEPEVRMRRDGSPPLQLEESRFDSEPPESAVEVHAGDLDVVAAVEVTFRLEQG